MNTTVTVTYDCPFRTMCSDNGTKCETCAYSPKRSYYRPVQLPISYCYPYYPYWQPWYTSSQSSTNESHYQL